MEEEEIEKAVLAYLKKKGFRQTELALQEEQHRTSSAPNTDPEVAKQILLFAESRHAIQELSCLKDGMRGERLRGEEAFVGILSSGKPPFLSLKSITGKQTACQRSQAGGGKGGGDVAAKDIGIACVVIISGIEAIIRSKVVGAIFIGGCYKGPSLNGSLLALIFASSFSGRGAFFTIMLAA
eukprot:Gb_03026 [translate_table: standard]